MYAFLVLPVLVTGSLLYTHPVAAAPVAQGVSVGVDTLRLTLADVGRLARTQGLDLDAERRLIEMAGGDLRQARLDGLNPTGSYQRFESARPGSSAEFSATLSQDLGWLFQRGPRVGAARAAVDRTVAEVGDIERLALLDAGQRFVASLAAQRRLTLAQQMATATQRLYDVTRIQLREGEISLLEANLAEIEFGRAQARALEARRELTTSLHDLRRLIGVAPTVPISLVETAGLEMVPIDTGEDSLVATALRHRPDVAARRFAFDEAALRQRLASREGIPTPSLNGILIRDDGEVGSRMGVGVSLPIPLFNRNQGRAEREAYGHERARVRLEALQFAVRLEVREALLAYQTAQEESTGLEARVLDPSRANITLLDSAYQAGKIGLPTLLLLRNQLVEAELDYWHAWQVRREALLRLQAAIGLPVGAATPTTKMHPENTP